MSQKSVLIRLNLEKEEDRKAWEYLQGLDKTVYKSYTAAFVVSINDFFARQEKLKTDPFLTTREREDAFLQRVMNAVEQGMQSARRQQAEKHLTSDEEAVIEQNEDPEQRELNQEVLSFLDSI